MQQTVTEFLASEPCRIQIPPGKIRCIQDPEKWPWPGSVLPIPDAKVAFVARKGVRS